MTHASVPCEERAKAGIVDELVRVAVGCEAYEDLREDLDRALTAIGCTAPAETPSMPILGT